MKKIISLILLIIGGVLPKADAQEIYGNDFWYSFVDNLGVIGVSAGPASNYPMRFVIISLHNVTGTITTPNMLTAGGIPWSTTFTVARNSQTTIVLPYKINGVTAFVDAKNIVQGKAFHITTDSMATVYAVNDGTPGGGASVDGEVVLPTNMLDDDYVVNSRSSFWTGESTDINVIATQNNTHVVIKTLKNAGGGAQADVTYNVTLNKGQTYQTGYFYGTYDPVSGNYIAPGGNVSSVWDVLTGSEVSADKPIAVISSTNCGGADDCGACDVMMNEQMPISFWGIKYILAQPIKRSTTLCGSAGSTSEADYVEIVGKIGQVITFTNWSGTFTKTITAIPGSSYATYGYIWYDNPYNPSVTSSEWNGESNLVLTSPLPFGVVQYQKGWQTDNVNNTDPEATVCYPESMWTNNYLAGTAALSGGASTQDILIVVNNIGSPSPISTMSLINAASGAPVVVNTTTCPSGSNGPSPVGDNCWQAIKGPAGSNYMSYRAVLPAAGVPYIVKNTAGYKFGYYFSTTTAAASYIVQGGGGSEPPIPSLLPITLINFQGKSIRNKVLLNWSTASEQNAKEFEIQRISSSGNNFESIGKVAASGNSGTTKNYSYTDVFPIKGLSIYRLKEIDYSGNFVYSDIIAVDFKTDKIFVLNKVIPNPAIDNINISLNTGSLNNIKYYISDITGRKLLEGQRSIGETGNNSFPIDISTLNNGVYFIVLQQEGAEELIQTKFIKN